MSARLTVSEMSRGCSSVFLLIPFIYFSMRKCVHQVPSASVYELYGLSKYVFKWMAAMEVMPLFPNNSPDVWHGITISDHFPG